MNTIRTAVRRLLPLFITLALCLGFAGCGGSQQVAASTASSAVSVAAKGKTSGLPAKEAEEPSVTEDGEYTSKEEVAAYIHAFGHLPDNYITKREAEELGWENREGNLWEVAPGKSIGGSKFGNYEGNLPEKKGRKYYECDIDFEGGYRGAKRIIYSSDGLIFYTEDHYEHFQQYRNGSWTAYN